MFNKGFKKNIIYLLLFIIITHYFFLQKPHYQTQTTRANGSSSFRDGNHQAGHSHITFREFADAGFSNKLLHSHIHKTDHNNTPHRGQNNRTKNERNLNQRREQKKTWEQQKHGQKDGRRPAYRSGRPQRAGGGNRKNEVKMRISF